jgi:hypothetical protein
MSFSSIDPVAIKAANDRIQSAAKTLTDAAAGLKSDLERAGIPTDGVRRIGEIGSWVHDQLPMLRRRQNLAEAMSARAGHIANGAIQGVMMPDVPDSFLSGADANRKGQELADRLMSALLDHEKLPPDLLAELQANSMDPDYMKGFYDKLTPEGLCTASQLVMASDYYRDHGSEADAISSALGTGLATYSRTTRLDDAWMNRIAFPKDFPGGGQFQPEVLAFVMRGSSGQAFDPAFLRAVGKKTFSMNIGPMQHRPLAGSWKGDAYTQFTKTISENALASAWVYQDNADAIHSASMAYSGIPPERQNALAALVKQATIGVQATDPKLADLNVAHLLFQLSADDTANAEANAEKPGSGTAHAFAAMQAVYGEIAHERFNDVAYSVTTLTPQNLGLKGADGKPMSSWDDKAFPAGQDGDRAGIEVPPELWSGLIHEGMRDPKWAAGLAADFQGYVEINRQHLNGQDEKQSQLRYHANGLMQAFYRENFAYVGKNMGDEIGKWVEDTNAARKQLISAGFTIVAAGLNPEEAAAKAKELTVGVLEELGSTLYDSLFDKFLAAEKNDAPLTPILDEFEKTKFDTSWQAKYQGVANAAGRDMLTGARPIPPVTDAAGRHYDGDPRTFVHGPDDDFLAPGHGGVKPVEEMTMKQAAAYARWLADPAVVAASYGRFRNEQDGDADQGSGHN